MIEIEPALKRRLYSALAIDNSTLKQSFVTSRTSNMSPNMNSRACLKLRPKK